MNTIVWSKIVGASGMISMALAVALGAFGAHGLKTRVTVDLLQVWQTAVFYHIVHSLALVMFSLWLKQHEANTLLPFWCFLVGILLFSGSLYALTLTGIKVLGAITPLGGLAFIIGWIAWCVLLFLIDFKMRLF